jgi:predicted negative regulator of RcsB-dependent stress response
MKRRGIQSSFAWFETLSSTNLESNYANLKSLTSIKVASRKNQFFKANTEIKT